MAIQLNHTIVACRDKKRSSTFLAEMLGLPRAKPFGPFLVVDTANGVSLAFLEDDGDPIASQHYAFLIGEDDFDAVFGRIRERPRVLGRPLPGATGRDQPQRRRARRLLQGSGRAPPRGHHPPVQQPLDVSRGRAGSAPPPSGRRGSPRATTTRARADRRRPRLPRARRGRR